MRTDRDNAIAFPGEKYVNRPRLIVGTIPAQEAPARFPLGGYYSTVNGETFDRFTKSTQSIMNKNGRKKRAKGLQRWWHMLSFIYQ